MSDIDDVLRIYAVRYPSPDGGERRIVGILIPWGQNARLRWHQEERDPATGGWIKMSYSILTIPPRDALEKLIDSARHDARLLGYRVGTTRWKYYLPRSFRV